MSTEISESDSVFLKSIQNEICSDLNEVIASFNGKNIINTSLFGIINNGLNEKQNIKALINTIKIPVFKLGDDNDRQRFNEYCTLHKKEESINQYFSERGQISVQSEKISSFKQSEVLNTD